LIEAREERTFTLMIATSKKRSTLVSVSPNAAKGSFRVYYPRAEFTGTLSAHLLRIDGEVLDIPIEVQTTAGGEVDIKISNPSSGIFYLRIVDGRTSVVKKIIVQ
jgi:hypothetical protein